jgi:CRISPR/Cas system CSM-associated protein Csm2 small subunit
LSDKTFAQLIDDLTTKKADATVTPELRETLLRYFADPNAPIAIKKNSKQWEKLQKELETLKQTPATPSIQPAAE